MRTTPFPEDTAARVPLAPRVSDQIPQLHAQDASLGKRHFRKRAVRATEVPKSESLPTKPLADALETLALEDSLKLYPCETRVEVKWPNLEPQWWPGVIEKSWIPKKRDKTASLEHHVVVRYDGKQWTHDPREHSLAQTEIRLEQTSRSARRGDALTDGADDVVDDPALQRKLERLRRALS